MMNGIRNISYIAVTATFVTGCATSPISSVETAGDWLLRVGGWLKDADGHLMNAVFGTNVADELNSRGEISRFVEGELEDWFAQNTDWRLDARDYDQQRAIGFIETRFAELLDATGATGDRSNPQSRSVDFGNNTGSWANDGECDDPRFRQVLGEPNRMASTLVEADRGRDASDCRSAYDAGAITFIDGQTQNARRDGIYGNDTSEWSHDGECDDPRFEPIAGRRSYMATTLVDADRGRDATDCQAGVEANLIQFKSRTNQQATSGRINTPSGFDFGDNLSIWANDGECDDPRFRQIDGQPNRMASTLDEDDRGHDAQDCREALENGYIVTLTSGSSGISNSSSRGIDFGNDSSQWSQDGECDDPRFIQVSGRPRNMATTLREEDKLSDATDCEAAYDRGNIELR